MIENIKREKRMLENELIQIMKSLTGWRLNPSSEDISYVCDISEPNRLAYMGLMETYEIKFTSGTARHFHKNSRF